VNIADELIKKNSALESELSKMQSSSGESLTLYTSYFTSYVLLRYEYDNTGYMTSEKRATSLASKWKSK